MASIGLNEELERARLHYSKGEDVRNSLIQRKDSYELAGRIFLEISTKLNNDDTTRSAIIYLASTAIDRASELSAHTSCNGRGSNAQDQKMKSVSGSIPVATQGRLSLDKFSKERIDGISKIKVNTVVPSTDLVNDLILLEQKLSEIGYTKAPVKSKLNNKTREKNKSDNQHTSEKRIGIPVSGSTASSNNNNDSIGHGIKGNQMIQGILGVVGNDKVSESTYNSVNQVYTRQLHVDDSAAKNNAFEMGFDTFDLTNLASSFSPLHTGSNENLIQLLSTIKRLNNENMSLIHRLENIKAKEQLYDDGRKDVEAFKRFYEIKLMKIRQFVHDISKTLSPEDNLAREYLPRLEDIKNEKNILEPAADSAVRANDTDARRSKTSEDTEKLLRRQSQLEKMVDKLVVRLEASAAEIKQKDKLIATLQKQLQHTVPIHVGSNNTSTVLKGSTSTLINTLKRK